MKVYERYIGLNGQERVGLVDEMGRVYHHDINSLPDSSVVERGSVKPDVPGSSPGRAANWDERFLDLAKTVASWSKDPSTKCGAVIVRPDKTIVSTGFNGFPKRCSDSDEVYADRDLKMARVIHAEVNAILHAREPLEGYTMYTQQIPNIGPSCDRCTAHVIQVGIKRVIYKETEIPERWKESIKRGFDMYKEANVEVIGL